jgi:apolipoprotein N-acyltransferase
MYASSARTVLFEARPGSAHREAWALLAAAAALLPFANGRNTIALAAWLAPVFLLRFARGGRGWRLWIMWGLLAAAWAVQFRGMVPAPQPALTLIWLGSGGCALLPFAVDRVLFSRLRGFAATLVFPCAAAGFDYLLSLLPYGSWGSPAYTQYGNLPLMQLVSVTGIYGITFLLAWFAAVVNWAWDAGFEHRHVRRGVLGYLLALAAVLAVGAVRLMFAPSGPTVRVASLTAPNIARFANPEIANRAEKDALSSDDVQQISAWSRRIDEDLLRRAAVEADAGAKIVFWAEGNSYVLPADEPWLLARASELARAKQIYLGLGNVVWHYGERQPLENTFVLFDPAGNLVWKFLKAHPVPGGEAAVSRVSDGRLKFTETPYGRLSNVICFDADSVQLLHQAGRGRASLMLVPANDWRAIDPWHAQMAVFRAVEQGFNLVRHASKGLSVATDYQGRVRAQMDHYQTAGERQMVAEVPTAGVPTVYSRVGDLFSWLALAALAGLTGLAVRSPAERVP